MKLVQSNLAKRHGRRLFAFLIIVGGLVLSGLPAGALELKARIEEFRQLPPVEKELMPGQPLDKETLPTFSANNFWVEIPEWLAGTWQHKTYTTVGGYDYVNRRPFQGPITVKDELTRTYGMQRDAQGGYWHYIKAPYSYTSEGKQTWNFIRGLSEEFDADPQRVIMRVIGTGTRVQKPMNIIFQTYQEQSINRYEPAGKDLVHIASQSNAYDHFGRLTQTTNNEVIIKRTKKFKRVDEQDGQNLRLLFKQYLTMAGREDLIPKD